MSHHVIVFSLKGPDKKLYFSTHRIHGKTHVDAGFLSEYKKKLVETLDAYNKSIKQLEETQEEAQILCSSYKRY